MKVATPVLEVAKGSTPHFVVAMVIFRDLKEAEQASQAIEDAREKLRIKPEFKFNKCSNQVRDGFFEVVQPFKFSVRALVVDKATIYSEGLREDKGRFYNYFVRMLLEHDGGTLQGARVKIDGSGRPRIKQELGRYLRSQSEVGKLASIKFSESHRDNLIQLADMAAGAIFRSIGLTIEKTQDAGAQCWPARSRMFGNFDREGSPSRPSRPFARTHHTVTIRHTRTRWPDYMVRHCHCQAWLVNSGVPLWSSSTHLQGLAEIQLTHPRSQLKRTALPPFRQVSIHRARPLGGTCTAGRFATLQAWDGRPLCPDPLPTKKLVLVEP